MAKQHPGPDCWGACGSHVNTLCLSFLICNRSHSWSSPYAYERVNRYNTPGRSGRGVGTSGRIYRKDLDPDQDGPCQGRRLEMSVFLTLPLGAELLKS